MLAPPHASTVYSFGIFQVNLPRRELFRHGTRVKIQDKPFHLLAILLEQPGEVVTREELQRRLWSADTFVEFNDGLNVAANKLRLALSDSADNPRFVETVPRQGYRFIAPVTKHEESSPGRKQDVSEIAVLTPAPEEPLNRETASAPSLDKSSAVQRRRLIFVLAGVLGLVLATGIYFHLRDRPRLTDRDTIVLADFVNTTGDSVFDGTLRQGLAIQLEQSPFLSIMSEERIGQTLGLMGKAADTRLTPAIAREICERTGFAAVLDGSIAPLGSQYVLALRATECRTGKVLAEEQVQAARKEDVLRTLSKMASRFRTSVGESLTTIRMHNTPLTEATTPSLEALKAYSTAWKLVGSTGEAAAQPFFKRAVEIDPQFAMAYAALGLMYGATGESALAGESTSKAYALRDRVSDKEKFFIVAYYYGRVTGNQEKAQQTCEAWVRAYPREPAPHAFLSGFIYPGLGNYEKSIEEGRRTIELDPDSSIGYLNLGYAYIAGNRLSEAESISRMASDRRFESPELALLRYDLAFLKADTEEMKGVVLRAQGKSGTEDWVSDHQASVLAYSGRFQEAWRTSKHAAALAQLAGQSERAALFETGPTLWEAMFGNAVEAKASATALLKLAKDREVDYGAAFALALSGDSARTQALASDLQSHFPEDTSVRFSYLPTLRALIALNHGEPARAVELLQVAVPYEMGQPRSSSQGFFGALYPVYVRGAAYLALNRGKEAAAEFQKIIDYRGIGISDPIGALAHLQLARAYAMSGNRTRARSAYQDFLALWKDADPEISILKKARMEYAKLN